MSSSSPDSRYSEFSRANCLKKGAMFGFALGMLAGLIWIGLAPPDDSGEIGTVAITRWRNVILAGIGIGFLVGACWPKPKDSHTGPENTSASSNS
ncbi:MAG: hypothetical protein HUJ26_15715 [Planctomycetaceae bacterium]|nr:hypothetical protein [Planctomycetaceae bacterium]